MTAVSHTWHTNLDTYERIIEVDAQQTAMVIAAAVYHLAMRDQMLPRLPKRQDAAAAKSVVRTVFQWGAC
jgi:carboxypeptidase Q